MGAAKTILLELSWLQAERDRDPGIRTILFTDIVDSTSMTQHLGDEAAMELLASARQDRARCSRRPSADAKSNTPATESWLHSFPRPVPSNARPRSSGTSRLVREEGKPIQLRIGVAAGEPVEHHNDLFGCTVQLAARLCSQARRRTNPGLQRGRRIMRRQDPLLSRSRRSQS